jgi:PBP1b-binding outer membrane lipoprotein LpoB
MAILRVFVLPIVAAFLAGCAAPHIPVYEAQDGSPATTSSGLEAQDDVPTAAIQPDRTMTAKVSSETKKPKPPAPKPATASTTSHKDAVTMTSKNVGSPGKLERERAEDERKERQLKQVIEGICRGC